MNLPKMIQINSVQSQGRRTYSVIPVVTSASPLTSNSSRCSIVSCCTTTVSSALTSLILLFSIVGLCVTGTVYVGETSSLGEPSVGEATDFFFNFSVDFTKLDLRVFGNGGFVSGFFTSVVVPFLLRSVDIPVTAMLTGLGRLGAAIGLVLMFTELVTLLVLC